MSTVVKNTNETNMVSKNLRFRTICLFCGDPHKIPQPEFRLHKILFHRLVRVKRTTFCQQTTAHIYENISPCQKVKSELARTIYNCTHIIIINIPTIPPPPPQLDRNRLFFLFLDGPIRGRNDYEMLVPTQLRPPRSITQLSRWTCNAISRTRKRLFSL